MIASGLVKLLAGDAVWNDLTALTYHYWTQPIPNALAWYAHQLPVWAHQSACFVMFVIELGVPCAIFGPRALRVGGIALALIALQLLIALTGSYTFFNLLTVALCVVLFDDRFLSRFVRRFRRGVPHRSWSSRVTAWPLIRIGQGRVHHAAVCGLRRAVCECELGRLAANAGAAQPPYGVDHHFR